MISANIKGLRFKKGISQDRLSKLADLSLNTIVKVESGRNPNPTIKTLIKIANALKVRVDTLIKIFIIVFLSTLLSGRSLAAEAVAKPADVRERVITLSEGIKMVLADSRLIKISLTDDEMAYQDSLMSRSALMPRVSLNAEQTYLRFQPASKFGATEVNTAQKDSFSYGVSVYQTLFDFGKSLSDFKAANEIVKAREARTESVKRMAILEFITAYFDLLETYKLIAVFEKEVESLTSYLNDIDHLYEEGVVVKNDVLPASVRLADVKQKLIAAANAKEVALARLNNILSLPLTEKLSLTDIDMKSINFPDMESAWNTAKVQRPEVLFIEDQALASKAAERSKGAGNLPVIYADGGYSREENKYVVHQSNYAAVIGAKMDLYDGGLTRAQVLKERTRQKQLEVQKDKLIEDIKFEIENSYFTLKNSYEKVLVARDALDQAQENVRFYRTKYSEGSATPTEVLEAIAQESVARTNYSSNDYEVKRSYAKLMYSMGIDLSLIYEKMENR
jgi:outer membrane protein TolC/DNA-binding XRE family transcriptional regulator